MAGRLDDLLPPGNPDAAGLTAVCANSALMADETRLERRLDRLIGRAENPRKAAVVIASVTTFMTLLAGWVMTLTDHDAFPTLGSGLWWAVQTVTTVGYGDHVPTSAAGKGVAALVMLLGIGFLTVITASITGAFVARSRREQKLEGTEAPSAELMRQIDERLARIEAALEARS
jgi:voltage-gated potassium channel